MRSRSTSSRLLLVITTATTLAVLVALLGAPAQARPERSTGTPVESTPAAEQALSEAQDVLTTSPGERAATALPHGRDATIALRDLRLRLGELDEADRAAAERLLARPSLTTTTCFTLVCVHWTATGDDKATQAYVNQAGAIADQAIGTYVGAGYRAPLPDGSRGGNAKLDIYLENIGDEGLYGYCTSDDPNAVPGNWTAFAYCAFDNDYSAAEFPTNTPIENLQVTAAHEIFHAVQYAYDWAEDAWFMEATAAWAEDELYDGVDDNVQYLAASPLSRPGKSMDEFTGVWHYGDWIFFRYLTERFPKSEGGLPTLVRDQWRLADAATGGKDDYSIRAVAHSLSARKATLRHVYADFAAGNRRPSSTYDEGAANRYSRFVPGVARSTTLSRAKPGTPWLTSKVNHLASTTVRYVPSSTVTSAYRLRLKLNLPSVIHGSAAVVTVYGKSGSVATTRVPLNSKGDGTLLTAFGRARKVEVTLSNAGISYSCWQGTNFSCQGRSRNNNLAFQVWATALR